jgi:hypothetical protein
MMTRSRRTTPGWPRRSTTPSHGSAPHWSTPGDPQSRTGRSTPRTSGRATTSRVWSGSGPWWPWSSLSVVGVALEALLTDGALVTPAWARGRRTPGIGACGRHRRWARTSTDSRHRSHRCRARGRGRWQPRGRCRRRAPRCSQTCLMPSSARSPMVSSAGFLTHRDTCWLPYSSRLRGAAHVCDPFAQCGHLDIILESACHCRSSSASSRRARRASAKARRPASVMV